VGQDIESGARDAEEPGEPVARSYRLLAMLSLAAVGAVVLVPYAGLTNFGESDVLRTGDAVADPDPVDEPSAIPTEVTADSTSDYIETADRAQGAYVRQTATAGATSTTTTSPTPPAPPSDYSRPIPTPSPTTAAPAPPPPWASSRRTTDAGYIATDVGCAASTSAADLDEYFRARRGPVLGHDYQHVYPLGGARYLWLFQDTFVDQPGIADELDEAVFAHNTALVQTGRCFTLYHRGSSTSPTSFEPGTGEQALSRWFWPLGGELAGDRLSVFWAEMTKDPDPGPGDGLGWHPTQTWLATYDATTLERLEFVPAPNSGTNPIYGYAVASDARHTYLFGNTYDQNLERQGGWGSGPHSATEVRLARVPLGRLGAEPEYRTATGWSTDPAAARPISSRFWVENPMQPRFIGGQWVAATKQDGFWGTELYIDVAADPWGPWTTVSRVRADPRAGDPLMNTYHAHLMPWLNDGALVVSMSQNARDMLTDAFPHPERYRLQFLRSPLVPPPPTPTTTTPTTKPRPPREATTTSPRPTTPPRPTTSTSTTTTTTTTSTTTPTTRPAPTTDPCATPTSTTTSSTTTTTTTPVPTTTDPCAAG
jgi:hypothetical protein